MLPATLMNGLSSLLVLLPCLVSCAGQKYIVDVGAMFAKSAGNVALQNDAGTLDLGQNKNDLHRDLGLGSQQSSPYVRVQTDIGRHRVRANGFSIGEDGEGTLSRDFGGLVAGSQVVTNMQFTAIDANYGYELLRGTNYRFAGGAQLAYYVLDVRARSSLGFEEIDTSSLVPMPFVELEGLFGSLTIGANVAGMVANLGDADGRFLDTEAYVRWTAAKSLDFFGGYRYVSIDGSGTASGRDFKADFDVQGYFFGIGLAF